jgi:hypothetical protein
VDDTAQPIRAAPRDRDDADREHQDENELGVLNGVGRQLIADNQKSK